MTSSDSFLETVKENIDNKKLSDADFRQFIRNSMPSVDIRHLPKEQIGILEHTPHVHRVTVCVDDHEQDTIWNTYTGHGRRKLGMKKCKVVIMEE